MYYLLFSIMVQNRSNISINHLNHKSSSQMRMCKLCIMNYSLYLLQTRLDKGMCRCTYLEKLDCHKINILLNYMGHMFCNLSLDYIVRNMINWKYHKHILSHINIFYNCHYLSILPERYKFHSSISQSSNMQHSLKILNIFDILGGFKIFEYVLKGKGILNLKVLKEIRLLNIKINLILKKNIHETHVVLLAASHNKQLYVSYYRQ